MGIFKFKQFDIDQTGCAMKVNTDGALLGALVQYNDPLIILDIGTGTGVVALMLAQRYSNAVIDAVEIDPAAANTAARNFANSQFSSKLTAHSRSFQDFLAEAGHSYDLIVSNPPFFLNSLKNPDQQKTVARHASEGFFEELFASVAQNLSANGRFELIVPTEIIGHVIELAERAVLSLQNKILIKSFPNSTAHRAILTLGFNKQEAVVSSFVIYEREKQYSAQYVAALKDFFTIF